MVLNNKKKYIILGVIVSIAFMLWPLVFGNQKSPKNPTVIKIVYPKVQTVHKKNNFPTVLLPFENVNVRSRTDGIIKSIYFKEGQYVKAGDPLIQLDDSILKIQLKQSEAALEKDKALYKNAELELDRYQKLNAKDVVSKSSFDDIKSRYENLKASINYDLAAIDSLKVQVEFAKITSPINGIVGLRKIDVGNVIRQAETTVLVNVQSIDTLYALLHVPEKDALELLEKPFNDIKIELLSATGEILADDVKVYAVDNAISPQYGTIDFKVNISNIKRKLRPGLSAVIKLTTHVYKDVLVLPEQCISMGDKGSFVFKFNEKESRVNLILVDVMDIIDGMAVVKSDQIHLTDKIVLTGQVGLYDGVRAVLDESDNQVGIKGNLSSKKLVDKKSNKKKKGN